LGGGNIVSFITLKGREKKAFIKWTGSRKGKGPRGIFFEKKKTPISRGKGGPGERKDLRGRRPRELVFTGKRWFIFLIKKENARARSEGRGRGIKLGEERKLLYFEKKATFVEGKISEEICGVLGRNWVKRGSRGSLHFFGAMNLFSARESHRRRDTKAREASFKEGKGFSTQSFGEKIERSLLGRENINLKGAGCCVHHHEGNIQVATTS